jgi:hypothetical protein
MAKFSFTIRNTAGAGQSGLRVQVKDGASAVVAETDDSTLVDNDDGSYTTASDLSAGEYSVFTGNGAGTLVASLDSVPHGDPETTPSALPLPVAEGGTGAITAAAARTALGLEIGAQVQEYNVYLVAWGGSYLPALLTGSESERKWASYYANGQTLHSAEAMRTALGLGTAAVMAASDDPAEDEIPVIGSDSTLRLPTRTSHLTANSSNYRKMYFLSTGDSVTGAFGLYYIGKAGAGYEVRTVLEHTWDGA